jgi:hypothetical protein
VRWSALVPFFLLVSTLARAKSASEVPYGVAEAFSTGVRFVRIDRGCKITDKDPEAAFLSFECQDDDKTKRGTLEIWKVQNGAKVQVTLGDDPRYMELRFLELLERKLRDERGTPPSRAPAPPPVRPPDAGSS